MLLFFWLLTTGSQAWAQTSDLFISEYIEGSSNNKALEIYNGTGAPVDLAAGKYSVQMYFNGSLTVGTTITLTGTVANNDVFVLAHSSAVAAILAQANQTSAASFYNGDDAIVLKKGDAILDVIGQIGFDPGTEWGSGLTSTADNTLRRKSSVLQGDPIGNDAFDPADQFEGFATDTFTGLGMHTVDGNTQTPTLSVANITLPEGSSGTSNFTFTVTLSKAATTAVTFDIATANGTATTANSDYTAKTLTGQTIPAGSTTYTFTVTVTGDTQAEADETFAVNLTNITGATPGSVSATGTITNDDGVAITPIYAIQGSGTKSLLEGQKVTTTGVVVGDYQDDTSLKGFYIQDATGDNSTATSDGIFVYAPSSTQVAVGQMVQVSGTVAETYGLTQISSVTNITIQPGTATVVPTEVTLPVSTTDGLEQYEGMLVNFKQKLTVSQNYTLARYGEVWLSADLEYPFEEADGRLYNPTNFIDPTDALASGVENDEDNKAAITTQQDLHNRASILLDDASSVQNPATVPYVGPDNTLRVGSTIANLTGILSYDFSVYRVQPIPTQAPIFTYAPRPITPPAVGTANVKIASFNVLNYFNGDGNGGGFPTSRGADTPAEFMRQRAKIIAAIKGLDADVVGLLEIENDGDGTASAIADLVRGLNEATSAGTYDYIRDPANGGTGTDAIKVAFIYKPGVVTPVGAAIADMNAVHNRPPLAQTFKLNSTNETVTAIINHFKSKSGTGPGGDADLGDGQGGYNGTRVNQAYALVNFINTTVIPTAADPDVILLGDFNAYNEEDPIDVLRAAGFVTLFGPESYSYVFDGQSGSLDHALVSPSLKYQFTTGGKWHINADEPLFLDYNTEFKSDAQITGLYQPNPYRSSDHDPVLVGLRLTTPTISLANATATVNEDAGTYTVNLALSEATNQDATITILLTNGAGAAYGADYTTTPSGASNSFALTIAAGSTAASFTVNVTDDQIDEFDETIKFAISQVSGGVKLGNQITSVLTIKDNDVPVISFTQSGATTKEGSSAYTITLTSSIAPVSDQTITIAINDYDFQYGMNKDYITNPSGTTGSFTLTIPAGQTTASFTVTTDKNLVSKKNSPQSIDFTISSVSAGAAVGTTSTFALAIVDKKEITALQVSTYPNPVTSQATIKLENAGAGEVTITLYDLAGMPALTKKVYTAISNPEILIEVGQLPRGNYVLMVTMPNGTIRTHLLLK